MRDQARPITNDERSARIEKAKQLMRDEKLGAIVLTPGTSLVYFTNVHWSGGERLFACVIPAKGEAFFVCPAFEEDRAREQIAGRADVRTWQEDESPYALLARGLSDRGVSTGSIGIDETAKFVWSDGIAAAAPHAHIVSATPVTAGCRMIKDAHELDLMRIASAATLKVYEAVYRSLEAGMTQNDVSALINAAYRRVGFPGEASVQVGAYTALPHGSITPRAAASMLSSGTPGFVVRSATVCAFFTMSKTRFALSLPLPNTNVRVMSD